LDAEPETHSILAKIAEARSQGFREMLTGLVNPYGDGLAAEKIVQVLTTTPLSAELLIKRSHDS
jgi:UDP-N-acetylglucosamine 2-epimerase (non-hydrolysing)/GDP/UDP-N,N'-diacetylbacillosamine 2-epimerase (hydrolysing)